jgi:Zn-dependent peptidase ImmA (M78 family)
MLFRKYGDDLSIADRWSVQEIVFLAECEEFLDNELGIKKPKLFSYKPTGTYYIGHGKDAAKKLRLYLNERANIVNLNIYEDFRRIGMSIYRRSIESSKISGICINHPSLGILLLVNYDDDTYRQRFTIAHEVGHAIFDSSNGEPIISFSTKWSKDKLKERRANAFASEFLIPEEVINVIPDNRNWESEKLLLWANKLRVNTEPLLLSLLEHGLIDNLTKDTLSGYKIARSDKIDSEFVGQSPLSAQRMEFLFQKGLSLEYIKKCRNAYHSGLISLKRMTEMLLLTIEELYEVDSFLSLGIDK